jgi:hypothetical protein
MYSRVSDDTRDNHVSSDIVKKCHRDSTRVSPNDGHLDRPTVEGPIHLRRTDRHTFLSSQASQPQDFEIHLGVIFFSSVINMGMPLSQTVSTAGLKLPFVRKQL